MSLPVLRPLAVCRSRPIAFNPPPCWSLQSLRAALQGAGGVIFAASGAGFLSAKGVDCQVCWGGLTAGRPFGLRGWGLERRHPTPQPLLCSLPCVSTPAPCMCAPALQGVANVAEAVKEAGGQQRVVLVSSALVRCGAPGAICCGGRDICDCTDATARPLHRPPASRMCVRLHSCVPAALTTAGTPFA